jgi:FkbM family methyltransferase
MKGVPKFKAFNVGLGDVSEEATILRSSFSPSSSLLAMTPLHKELYPKSKDSFEEKIVIKRLDEMLPEMKIEENLFIKMDVQGYEGNVIRGAGKALAQAKLVQVETSFTPLYEGQPLFSDIHDLLHPLGFSYIGNTAQHWNASKNEPLFEDSLFIRQ